MTACGAEALMGLLRPDRVWKFIVPAVLVSYSSRSKNVTLPDPCRLSHEPFMKRRDSDNSTLINGRASTLSK